MMVTDGLREAIRRSDLSLSELARQSGIAVATLSRFVRQQGGLSAAGIDSLARILDVSLVIGPATERAPADPPDASPRATGGQGPTEDTCSARGRTRGLWAILGHATRPRVVGRVVVDSGDG